MHRQERQDIPERRARDAGERRGEREHEHDGRHHLPGALGTSAAEADDRREDEHGDEMRTDSVIRPAAVKTKNSPRLMSVASPIVSRAARGSLESAGWLDARMVLTEDLSSVGIRPAPPRRATIR